MQYLNRSWPAVSHIWSLIPFPPMVTILEPNSTPIVWLLSCLTGGNEAVNKEIIGPRTGGNTDLTKLKKEGMVSLTSTKLTTMIFITKNARYEVHNVYIVIQSAVNKFYVAGTVMKYLFLLLTTWAIAQKEKIRITYKNFENGKTSILVSCLIVKHNNSCHRITQRKCQLYIFCRWTDVIDMTFPHQPIRSPGIWINTLHGNSLM